MTAPRISKSQYMRGLQCPKNLWFYHHRKDLAPDISSQKQALFDTGHDIGALAKSCFNGGIDVIYNHGDISRAVQETKQYIKEGNDIIFEATVMHPVDGSYARIDVLKRIPETNEWDLIEIKGSTSVKDEYIDDISFQYHVFYHAGFRIRGCYLMLIDNGYVRHGDIESEKLFKLVDVSAPVFSRQAETENVAGQMGYILARRSAPDADIGARCFAPHECDFKAHCWKHVPAYSVYNAFTKNKADEIVKRHNSFDLKYLPAEIMPSGVKGIDVSCHLSGQTHIEPEQIKKFLAGLRYPLHFLDYETVASAIPLFDGTRPFQQIPFQFSLHIQESPGGDLTHWQYLHKTPSDPRLAFTQSLIESCMKEGSIVVYNQTFEMAVNNGLAQDFPKFSAHLQAINSRMADLLIPFRRRWLYSPAQHGSASIKAVLPAFTELSYNDMAIGNGGDASLQYQAFLQGELTPPECNALWDNLERYCSQDTYAMKVLLDVLITQSK